MAMTGASGAAYGIRLLEVLQSVDIRTHLIVSKAGALALKYETDKSVSELKPLADELHGIGDIGASIASGSFQTLGMIVAPCSIKRRIESTSADRAALYKGVAPGGTLTFPRACRSGISFV